MGEFAIYGPDQIKIGTCEDLYYLRPEQAQAVQPVDVLGEFDWSVYRFRFPWPDEDHVAPGQFEQFDKGWLLQLPPTPGVEHRPVEFHNSDIGYRVHLPCPETHGGNGLDVVRSRFAGPVHLFQQRLHDGCLVPVLRCVCGALWRLDTIDDCLELLAELQRQDFLGDECSDEIHRRVVRGFDREYVRAIGLT